MSSKSAGARAGKEVLYNLLSLIETGNPAEVIPAKLWYLKRQKYIGRIGGNYYLLPKGERILTENKVWVLKIPTPKKWDSKWHLVLFDIPADKRKRRDIFRARLRELGLVLYQNSVWIHPYPVEKVIREIAEFYKLESCVSFVVAEKVTGEKSLRSQFKLD